MRPPAPQTHDVVLIGGGHAHALLLRAWRTADAPGARLTLINPEPTAAYTGMLPGHIAGRYPRAALDIDLVKLCRRAGARLILGAADGIDRAARRIHVQGRGEIAYDLASLDIGVTSGPSDIPGLAAHAHAAKPLGPFADAWAAWCARVAEALGAKEGLGDKDGLSGALAEQGGDDAGASAAVIGGGVAGVELALAMAHRLRTIGATPQVSVIDAREPLAELGASARRGLLAALDAAEIRLEAHAPVADVRADAATLSDGRVIPSRFTVAAGGARPHRWLAATGLTDAAGYVPVDATLRSLIDPNIFAVGDCAHLSHAPRPKAGVFAVRQAPILRGNLIAALTGAKPQPYRPQRDYLKLISMGGPRAMADKWGFRFEGDWVWRLKDRIDGAFMATLDETPAPTPPQDQALCGGCGAKIGREALAAALGVDAGAAGAGFGEDAAQLRIGDATQVLSVDQLRAITLDPGLMARIAAIHALGDVWAMGAQPQAALANIILPPLGPRLQQEALREATEAARAVFSAAGAELVGGHSGLGAEMSIGFTVTGLAGRRPTTLVGAQPGDALLLTKPIGTGVVLAAEMMRRAPGRAVAAAYASMTAPSGVAAEILGPAAHAMTDVTGFGLANHLAGLLCASGVGGRVRLGAVPVLDGAEDLAEAGVASTLAPQNRAAAMAAGVVGPDTARFDLTLDPQTAGGLLAAVPATEVAGLLERLAAADVPAAQIGEATRRPRPGDAPLLRFL